MAGTWSVVVTLDADKTDVGQVAATFSDTTAGQPYSGQTFTYSDRVQATAAGRDAFINAAVAARNAWRTRLTSQASYDTNIASRFLTLDTSA